RIPNANMHGLEKDLLPGGTEECDLVGRRRKADIHILTFLIGLRVLAPLHFLAVHLNCIAYQWLSIFTYALAGQSAGLRECGNREHQSSQGARRPDQSPPP